MPAPQRVVCKILCPDVMCGSFIGDKGHRVKELEDSTNTMIHISKRGQFFPGLQGERIIAVAGFDAESIVKVITKVQDTISVYAATPSLPAATDFIGDSKSRQVIII